MHKRATGWILLLALMALVLIGGRCWLRERSAPSGESLVGEGRSGPPPSSGGKRANRDAAANRRERVLASWRRLQTALEKVNPEAVRTIAAGTGAGEEEIRKVEKALGLKLPGEFREFLKMWRGDEALPGQVFQDRWDPFYVGCDLAPLRKIIALTEMMNDVAVQDKTEDEIALFVAREPRVDDVWHPRLVQVTNSHGGSELAVDCHTGEIWAYCGANYGLEGIVAPSWKALLDTMAEALETGRYEIDELLYYRLSLRNEEGRMIE